MDHGPPRLREPPLGRLGVEVAHVLGDAPPGQPQPVPGDLRRRCVPAEEGGVIGVEPVVVAVADVRHVQPLVPGRRDDDRRRVADPQDVEDETKWIRDLEHRRKAQEYLAEAPVRGMMAYRK